MKYSYLSAIACIGAVSLVAAAPSTRHSSQVSLIPQNAKTAPEYSAPVAPSSKTAQGQESSSPSRGIWDKLKKRVKKNSAPESVSQDGRGHLSMNFARSFDESEILASHLSHRSYVDDPASALTQRDFVIDEIDELD